MDSFYLTLPSNTPFTGNKQGEFTVPLAHPIELTGRWEVGVSQLIIPVTYNTLEDASFSITTFNWTIHQRSHMHTETIKVPAGHYSRVDRLLDMLNEQVDIYWDKRIDDMKSKWEALGKIEKRTPEQVAEAKRALENGPHVRFELVDGRVELQINNATVLEVAMNYQLQYTLGFKQSKIAYYVTEDTTHVEGHSAIRAHYGADIRSGTDCFYIYCDIISPQLIGHAKAQVIKIVPAVGTYGSIHDSTYYNVDYCDLLLNRFDSVKIYIRTSGSVEPVVFDFGKVIVKLHFRRKKLL